MCRFFIFLLSFLYDISVPILVFWSVHSPLLGWLFLGGGYTWRCLFFLCFLVYMYKKTWVGTGKRVAGLFTQYPRR